MLRQITTSPVARFAVRRAARMAAVLIALVVVTFAMVRLVPGDPGEKILGLRANPRAVAELDAQLGLTGSLPSQFGRYATHVVRGDLGASLQTREPVTQVIGERLGSTVQLLVLAMAIVLLVGIPLGMVAGGWIHGHGGWRETGWSAATGVLGVVPSYVLATFLAFVFAVTLRWLPVAGSGPWTAALLPAIAIAVAPTMHVARLVRVETAGALEQEYLMAARAKRLPAWRLHLTHVMPNVLTSALTLSGVILASLVSGAVVVEQVFARPGLGTALVQALLAQDYPVVEGVTLLIGAIVVVVNAAVDLLLGLADPRVLEAEA
jgi:peptide/nickel transport system permease protein